LPALPLRQGGKLLFFLCQLALDDGPLLRILFRLKQLLEVFDIRSCIQPGIARAGEGVSRSKMT
jgi:hypothetical protein